MNKLLIEIKKILVKFRKSPFQHLGLKIQSSKNRDALIHKNVLHSFASLKIPQLSSIAPMNPLHPIFHYVIAKINQ